MTPDEKEDQLGRLIGKYQRVIVAFSGGVDSSYLAFLAHRVLGEKAHVVTAISPAVSESQKRLVVDFASSYGLNHSMIYTREMENPAYTENPNNRCYFCKSELHTYLERVRQKLSAEAVLDGSNADDLWDYRPGRQAAREHAVVSPFIEVGIGKKEVRALSRKWDLPSWDQPAMPCLSSRFPYGVEITEGKLHQVDQAENFLRDLGLRNFRVRHHEKLARIEVDRAEMAKILDLGVFERITRQLKALGYQYVTLDLQGFRSGSLNEILTGSKSGR